MRKVELLAPAGDLERLKVAVLYGADAVFIGGQRFSLRSRASNFTIDDIKEACSFAHQYGARVHVTCNIVMHNIDTEDVLSYLKELENAGVDCIIASSLYILKLVIESTKMEAHVSTQMSTANQMGVKFFKELGASRVVLARELKMTEIKKIKDEIDMPLEVFIHGGMCSSYSGRCMLSNNMTNRDANRGGCAHSCRWNYDLLIDDEKKNDDGYFQISSRDLSALRLIPKLIDLNVDSFKIEGRMKSLNYIAVVVRTYRKLIDEYYENGSIKDFSIYEKDLKMAENRKTGTGFLDHDITIDEMLYDNGLSIPQKDFVGLVLSYDEEKHICYFEQRNNFASFDNVTIFTPKGNIKLNIGQIYDMDGNKMDRCPHPLQKLYFYTDIKLNKYDLIRMEDEI
jgi:putative protease